MPTSPDAIARFLNHPPLPTIDVKNKDPEWLLDFIEKIGRVQPHFKSKLRQSQIAGVAFGLWAQRVLYYWDCRTGKTCLSLSWMSYLRRVNWIRRALIIAHAPVGVDEWQGQYKEHSDLEIAFIRSGPRAWDSLCDALDSNVDAICASRSTLQSLFSVKRKNRKDRMQLYPDKEKAGAVAEFFDCVVIDEIHKDMLEPGTLWFSIAELLVQHCEWRAGLTGTPFGRNPFSLWSQAYLIDGGKALSKSYYFFREAFGDAQYNHFSRTKTEYVFPKLGTKQYDERMGILRNKLRHMVTTCTLDEIQDTNVMSGVVKLRLSKEQQVQYRRVIASHLDLPNNENKLAIENVYIRLRQVASGFLPIKDPDTGDEHILELEDACKLVWLEDLFSELGSSLKTVILHEFTYSGELICRVLRKLKIKHGWLYGGTKQSARAEMLQTFQQGNMPVLVANAATGGTGINLSAANYLVFFESPSGVTRKQAEARPLARGSRPLVMDDIVCAPVEEKLLTYAAEGKELLADLLRDPSGIRTLNV